MGYSEFKWYEVTTKDIFPYNIEAIERNIEWRTGERYGNFGNKIIESMLENGSGEEYQVVETLSTPEYLKAFEIMRRLGYNCFI